MLTTLPRERLLAALLAALIQIAVGWALVNAFAPAVVTEARDVLKSFALTPPDPKRDPPPPPPPPPPKVKYAPKPAGSSAPAGARATPVTAPSTPLPTPNPIAVADVPSTGAAPTPGNADRGIGPGRGGTGNGFGRGNGQGNGDGDGGFLPPRRVSGDFRTRDIPGEVWDRRERLYVELIVTIEPDGRVSHCRIARPSGEPEVDRTLCQVASTRFRYRPSLGPDDRPVRAGLIESAEFLQPG